MSDFIAQGEELLALIPQRPPFVMIGTLKKCDEVSTVTSFVIEADNLMVSDGKLQEGGLIENIAQSAAAMTGYESVRNNTPVGKGFIGAVKNFSLTTKPKIGQEITTHIVVQNQVMNVTILGGEVFCEGEKIASCEMKIFLEESS